MNIEETIENMSDEMRRIAADAKRLADKCVAVIDEAIDDDAVKAARDMLIRIGLEWLEAEVRERLGLDTPPAD